MGSGAYMEFHQATVRRIFSPIRADVEEVPKLFDRIGQYSQLMGWTSPRIAADRTYDFIYPGLLKPLAYERQGVLLHPQSVLSGSIFAVTEAEAITRLQQSDFAILTASSSVDERSSAYPFNVSMQEVTPALLEWANQHLVPLRRFQFFNRDVVLYIRPSLGIRGTSAEWITSDGMTLTGIAEVLRARPRIELIGRASFEYLGKVPGISAKLARPGQTPKPIHATIRASGPNAYHIVIELHPEDIQLETPVRMHLSFDTYYVPKNMGLYDDARRLVMQIPNEIVLLRQK